MSRITLLFALFFLLTATASAESPVWKISNNTGHLYLAGTIHVLAADDYPLPAAFDRAYQDSKKLVFETDISSLQSADFQQALMQYMTYSDGKTLQTVLSEKTYKELASFMQSRGLPIAMFNAFKPSMVMLAITEAELKRLGMGQAGVDAHFFARATGDNKPRGQLEDALEQVAFLADMGKGQEDAFVRYSLQDIQQLADTMNRLKAAWVKGDLDTLERIALEPMLEEFTAIYNSLLRDRNNNWLPQIIAMLGNRETEMVLVGALHLVGPHGLLEQLEQKGYTVQRMH